MLWRVEMEPLTERCQINWYYYEDMGELKEEFKELIGLGEKIIFSPLSKDTYWNHRFNT